MLLFAVNAVKHTHICICFVSHISVSIVPFFVQTDSTLEYLYVNLDKSLQLLQC